MIEGSKQRESAFGFGDSGTISPDGVISNTDRQTLLGSYPFGEWGGGRGGFSVDIWMPHMVFPKTKTLENGETETGAAGKGSFRFEVMSQRKGGNVLVHLTGVSFEFENKADKTYRDLVGENAAPKTMVDDYDDDTDVA